METREVARRALALLAPGRAAAAPAPPRSPGPARAARHVGLAALLAALGAACAAPARWPTCLLYTSPSPRDGLLSRMPSSA